MSFARGLRSMPGIDDSHLDDSHSETGSRLEVPDMELEVSDVSENEQDLTLTVEQQTPEKAESMQFVSQHFKEPTPSESDDEVETSGLKFPDFREVDNVDQGAASATREGLLAAVASQLPSAITADIMSKTVSSLVSSTVAGISKLGQSMTAQKTSESSKVQPKTMSESVESDIMAEFEFLDDEDLDVDTADPGGK